MLSWAWRSISLALVLGWMSLIYFLSARSGAEVNNALAALAWLGPWRDVVGHLMLYAGLATLLLFGFWSWRSAGSGEFRWVALAVVLALLYGLSDEYHQTFVPGRAASLKDIIVDGLGATGAALAMFYVATRWRSLPWVSKRPLESTPTTAD